MFSQADAEKTVQCCFSKIITKCVFTYNSFSIPCVIRVLLARKLSRNAQRGKGGEVDSCNTWLQNRLWKVLLFDKDKKIHDVFMCCREYIEATIVLLSNWSDFKVNSAGENVSPACF